MVWRRACLAAVLCLGLEAQAAEVVHFPSAVVPPSPLKQRLAEAEGRELTPEPGFPIWGHLSRPDGDGPFPVLVLMHGCAGLFPADFRWAALLTKWGYVTLIVDSFRPRSVLNVCEDPVGPVSPMTTRPLDAYGALAYLAAQPFVDPDRIGVVGWSHGGISALAAVSRIDIASGLPSQFRAAALFYPYCLTDRSFDLPVLILIGEADDWTPFDLCARMEENSQRHGTPVDVVAYPGVHHGFDIAELQPAIAVPGAGGTMHRLAYDAPAHEDATERLKSFLAAHLGPQ